MVELRRPTLKELRNAYGGGFDSSKFFTIGQQQILRKLINPVSGALQLALSSALQEGSSDSISKRISSS